jgi:hypothetical protein
VIGIGYVYTMVEQDGTHGGDERWPQVDQVLNSRKSRKRKTKPYGLKAKV